MIASIFSFHKLFRYISLVTQIFLLTFKFIYCSLQLLKKSKWMVDILRCELLEAWNTNVAENCFLFEPAINQEQSWFMVSGFNSSMHSF